jgi:hypothetical protein
MDHKRNANNEKNKEYTKLLYQKFRESDFNDWYIELHEDYPTERKEQLNKRKAEIFREIGTLNKNIACRTIKEYQKGYKQNNKDKIKQYREDYKDKIKQYRETNKDKIRILCNK